jgi:toxin ParE1/3/4
MIRRMARVVLSPRARRDIVDVLTFTKERWGEAQARSYRDLIRDALKSVASNPTCGTQRHTICPGIWAHHIKQPGKNARHIVFYRLSQSETVEIVRLLHDSMDFSQHLT